MLLVYAAMKLQGMRITKNGFNSDLILMFYEKKVGEKLLMKHVLHLTTFS